MSLDLQGEVFGKAYLIRRFPRPAYGFTVVWALEKRTSWPALWGRTDHARAQLTVVIAGRHVRVPAIHAAAARRGGRRQGAAGARRVLRLPPARGDRWVPRAAPLAPASRRLTRALLQASASCRAPASARSRARTTSAPPSCRSARCCRPCWTPSRNSISSSLRSSPRRGAEPRCGLRVRRRVRALWRSIIKFPRLI